MQFQNDKRQPIEIDFRNFEGILQGRQFGLTPVKLKNGRVEWIRATQNEILQATAQERRSLRKFASDSREPKGKSSRA